MRLSPLPPEKMTPEQLTLHDDMAPVIAEHLKGFVSKRADGALIGPFAPILHFPQFGKPDCRISLASTSGLCKWKTCAAQHHGVCWRD